VTSFEILEFVDHQIELLETFPCNSKDELSAREGYYIRTTNCVNKCIAGRTDAEYREENREQYTEYQKQYYENNKEKLNTKIECECGCHVTRRNLARHKTSKKHIDLMK